MIHIDENQLNIFLKERKKLLEIKKLNGLGEIVSGFSLAVTLLCSDFKATNSITSSPHFEFGVWLLTFIIFGVGVFQLIKSICKNYTVEKLYNELIELDKNKEHVFNIVLLKNNENQGKFLVFKSKRWRCKLFPNYHALTGKYDKEKELNNIRSLFSNDIGIDEDNLTFDYLEILKNRKYSVGDKVTKQYIFHFFLAKIKHNEILQNKSFKHNGKSFYWMTLDQMYANKNISRKNKAVLDYVRNKLSIS